MDTLERVARRALPVAGALVLAFFLGSVTIPSREIPRTALPAAVLPGSVIALTNVERAHEGIPALIRNPKLDYAAQLKAEDMAKKGYYAHVSPEGLTPMHFVDEAGYAYSIVGENLVVQRTSAQEVIDAFMGSPGHRANILRPDFTEIGVGAAQGTYKGQKTTFTVQIFAKPRATQVVVAPKPAPKPVEPAPAPKPQPKPVVVTPKIVKDVEKVVAPVLAPLQATTTLATSTTATSTTSVVESVLPSTFWIPPSLPVALEREQVQMPRTVTFREQLALYLGASEEACSLGSAICPDKFYAFYDVAFHGFFYMFT